MNTSHTHSILTFRIMLLCAIVQSLLLLNGCFAFNQEPAQAATATEIPLLRVTKEPNPTAIILSPTMPTKATTTSNNLVSLDTLKTGEYLVLRGNDSQGKKPALFLVTSEGEYVGKLGEGHDFAYAAISPNLEWLAYVDGYNESSVLHLKSVTNAQDFTIGEGCKYPSWSPNSDYLVVACGKLDALSFSDGDWMRSGVISIPGELEKLPADVKEGVDLTSPSWSADGNSIAYYAILTALSPENSVLGPYISSTSCFFEEETCETKKLDLGEIHPRPILQRLQSSNEVAVYSYENNQSNLYLFDVVSAALVRTIQLKEYYFIDSFSFSPSNKFLAFKPSLGPPFLMDVEKNKVIEIVAPIQSDGLDVLFWITITP